MLKVFAAAALLGSVSSLVVMPADEVKPSHAAVKADRLETRSDAQVRNYLSPQLNGKPVAFCLSAEIGCGKEAADAFCRGTGFAEAIMFQRDNGPLVVFRHIKCRRAAETTVEAHRIVIEPAGQFLKGDRQ